MTEYEKRQQLTQLEWEIEEAERHLKNMDVFFSEALTSFNDNSETELKFKTPAETRNKELQEYADFLAKYPMSVSTTEDEHITYLQSKGYHVKTKPRKFVKESPKIAPNDLKKLKEAEQAIDSSGWIIVIGTFLQDISIKIFVATGLLLVGFAIACIAGQLDFHDSSFFLWIPVLMGCAALLLILIAKIFRLKYHKRTDPWRELIVETQKYKKWNACNYIHDLYLSAFYLVERLKCQYEELKEQ